MINTAEIHRLMIQRNITSDRLRRACGITDREIRGILDGRYIPSWEHLVKIANELGCLTRDLICEVSKS